MEASSDVCSDTAGLWKKRKVTSLVASLEPKPSARDHGTTRGHA